MQTRLITSLLLVLVSLTAHAEIPDFLEQVTVKSERNSADLKKDLVIYEGNVQVTQGSMKMLADRLVVSNVNREGPEQLLAEGNPATFSHIPEGGQAMQAQATQIIYDIASRELLLKGNAQISQQDSMIQGDQIRYSLEKQQLQVEGGEQGVTSIFIPKQVQQQMDKQDDEQ